MNKPTNIIVHCSMSAFGDAELIRQWHVKERGWKDIGYHFVILNGKRKHGARYNLAEDGLIETGRPLNRDGILEPWEFGAHALGYNDKSIGVCFIGDAYRFTVRQIYSGIRLLGSLAQHFDLLTDRIFGHNEVVSSGRLCPMMDCEKLRELTFLYPQTPSQDPWQFITEINKETGGES